MTIFNSTNVLIGVGILALPLGLRYSGWVIGITLLSLAAASTAYTALLLAKCLDTNTACTTYGDIAFLAFGSWGRNSVESLFILELLAANVALVILFGDTMSSLLPQLSVLQWKALISLGLIPLNFVPFKALSFSSVVGIFCCLGIIIIVFTDGLIKPHSPGSLRDVAITWAFPEDWRTIPLSLGLFLAPWGGHSVFPAIYKDMRHPQKYQRAVKYTYIFTYGLDMTMAVLGYLMFGDRTRDEITANILSSTFYPRPLSILITVLISIIPVTKIPLTNRPIMDTVNKKFYIDLRQMDPKARLHSEKSLKHRLGRGSICVLANVAQLGLAILIPDFDSIMALMGSAFCFTICIILPVTFYLKIFNSDDQGISKAERILCWCLALVSTVLATIGTVFAVLPKHKIGASG
jgi:vesicular inhibitory amino acid transporter